ncbi:MAG TPA: hypothetical protein VFS54_03140 [Solirubrobacterales bacterium]|nr:hypothetical protein [Solirubrobacterales bacterium]
MKYVKMLGLLAIAAAAMMAFAATASADTVTQTETDGTTNPTPTIHAVNEGGHVTLQNPIATISCSSTVTGTVTTHEAGKPVTGHISELLFTGCTNSWHVTTVTAGHLTFEASNGELKSSSARVETTRLGVKCFYETAAGGTKVGTVTGGSPATLHIEASIPLGTGSSGLCGTGNAKWEGNYVTTHPLHLDDN